MKKALILLVLLCFVTTGCTGSFNLTKKVYNFHRSQDDKWTDEVMFLVVVLLPVYGISTFADAVIFNSIEFWTGENPVEMTKALDNGKLVVRSENETHPTIQLEKADGMIRVSDESGNLLYASTKNAKGELLVYNSELELVKNYSPEEVQQYKDTYLK